MLSQFPSWIQDLCGRPSVCLATGLRDSYCHGRGAGFSWPPLSVVVQPPPWSAVVWQVYPDAC